MATVLIADDDASIRETVRFVLEDAGYTVIDTPNGHNALEIMQTSSERLIVLLDMRMPDDGQSVLADIEQTAPLAERHRYILFTALPRMPPPVAVNLALPILHKPFDVDVLLAAVARAADSLDVQDGIT